MLAAPLSKFIFSFWKKIGLSDFFDSTDCLISKDKNKEFKYYAHKMMEISKEEKNELLGLLEKVHNSHIIVELHFKFGGEYTCDFLVSSLLTAEEVKSVLFEVKFANCELPFELDDWGSYEHYHHYEFRLPNGCTYLFECVKNRRAIVEVDYSEIKRKEIEKEKERVWKEHQTKKKAKYT